MTVSKNNSLVVAAQSVNAAKEKFLTVNKRMGDPLIWEREARFALQHVQNMPQLQEADPVTIRDAVINVATMGLSLNPATQQVALIPRWNKRKGMNDCTATPMYRGLVKLATDAGAIKSIQAGVIYEDDEYDIELGTQPHLVVKPNSAISGNRNMDLLNLDKNQAVAAYCVATLPDGDKLVEIISLDQIIRIAAASDSFRKGKGPWATWPEEMARKSVIRRAQKTWPAGSNVYQEALDRAIEVMTEADVNDSAEEDTPTLIDGEATTVISDDEAKQLRELCRQQGLPVAKVYEMFGIEKMEQMPIDKFDDAKARLVQRLAAYQEKHGVDREAVSG